MGMTLKQRREVEDLTWRYIDDVIQPRQFKRLESLLREHEEARKQYVECVMLHVQLYEFFSPKKVGLDGKPRINIANDTFLSQLLDTQVQAPAEKPRVKKGRTTTGVSRTRKNRARAEQPSPAAQ